MFGIGQVFAMRFRMTVRLEDPPDGLWLRRGPLAVTVERLANGRVEACFPLAALSGEGESEGLAIKDLGRAILAFYVDVQGRISRGVKVGGPLLKQWRSVREAVGLI